MKTIPVVSICLLLTGCGGNTHRSSNNYDSIRENAKAAKSQEEKTYKVTLAQELAVHKSEQAKYNDMIKNPERYADVVDISTGAVITSPDPVIPGKFNDTTPEHFQISPSGNKFVVPQCKDGVCH